MKCFIEGCNEEASVTPVLRAPFKNSKDRKNHFDRPCVIANKYLGFCFHHTDRFTYTMLTVSGAKLDQELRRHNMGKVDLGKAQLTWQGLNELTPQP